MSRSWSLIFRALYRFLRWTDPVIRAWYRAFGLGNVVELRVRSRRSGRMRSIMVGVLRTDVGLYLGHPDGHAEWTLDLEAAGQGELVWRDHPPLIFRPLRLSEGSEREAVIEATDQHPFPGGLIYRLGRRHVRAAGVYYRLDAGLERIRPRPSDGPSRGA